MKTTDSKKISPTHGRWLICRPKDYDVRYKINPWMDLSNVPDQALAVTQWSELEQELLRCVAQIEYIEHADGQPDMVFTANGGLVRGQDVVRARFRHAERGGEERHFQTWFESNGMSSALGALRARGTRSLRVISSFAAGVFALI